MNLAIEKDVLEAVCADMRLIANTCEDSRELRTLLKSPVVKPDKKAKILNKVFAGRIGEMAQAFMGILVRKGRESKLFDVAKAFDLQYKAHMHINTFEVTTAQAMDDAARAVVMEMARGKVIDGDIDLIELVDPTLIGGVVIRFGDEQWDGSVSRKLNDLRKNFSKNPYIAEI
jgi:F-type H+-transporting ATPase subunit delta